MSNTDSSNDSKHLQVLYRKSIENYECAIKAQNIDCFNVAVSRLYYSGLLMLKRCLIESGVYTERDFMKPGAGSHVFIIDSYIQNLFPKLEGSCHYTMDICYIRTLKDHRRDADYSPEIDYNASRARNKFEECFKSAKKCLRAIESIHNVKIINREEDDE